MLEKLAIRQIVEGIAVLPAGKGVELVDVVMRVLSANDTWAVTITIPPAKEEADDASDWRKKYEVLSIIRLSLRSLGFSTEGITSLTDEEMQRIADTVRENILFTADTNFDEEVRFVVASEIVEKRGGTTA